MTPLPAAPPVWGCPGIGFGDLWSSVNYCARKSEQSGRPTRVSRWSGPDRQHDLSARLAEMLSILELPPRASVEIVEDDPTQSTYGECWATRYCQTRRSIDGLPTRWDRSLAQAGKVAYQFDGKSSAAEKNPPPGDVARFIEWGERAGMHLVPIGLPLSIADCANTLATSCFFVGVCSGMSHLCHSVGTPTFILEYHHAVGWWHGPNPFIVRHGVDDLVSRLPAGV